jgi:hypothetical protein
MLGGRGRLIRLRFVLVRRVAFGMAFQLADVVTLAGEEEY